MDHNYGEPIQKETANITEEQHARLKELFPQAFTEGRVDWDRLRAALGDLVGDSPERYTFTWAGKRDAIRLLQTPTRATLVPCREESVSFDATQHLFIEGDNLEVLKLLYKPYFGRVKMIYIDPPYNTGKEFIYPDNYADPLATYLQLTGQQDAAGNLLTSNPETSGRYHSAWLSMMYPRLFLARQLLREDGVIFVSIDDHEVHNLRLLMNEVFGEENFVSTIIWEKKYAPQNDARWLSDNHDYVLLYARSKETWRPNLLPRTEASDARYTNPDRDPRGPWKSSDLSVRTYTPANDYPITTPSGRVVNPPEGRCWVVTRSRYEELVADDRIWFGERESNVPALKRFLSEVKPGITSLTIWSREEVGDTHEARRTIRQLFGDTSVFDTPKACGLIRKMLFLSTDPNENDVVLDFFAGSCTTAQAVLEQNAEDGGNRRFIMVQLPEPTGLDEFPTVAEVGKERIRRVIAQMEAAGTRGFKVFKLRASHYRQWEEVAEASMKEYARQMALFSDRLLEGWDVENVIYEVALKKGLGLNCSINVVASVPGNMVYRVTSLRQPFDGAQDKAQDSALDEGGSFYICLDQKLDPAIIQHLPFDNPSTGLRTPQLTTGRAFVCRDVALTDDLAANLALSCRLETI